VRARIRKTVNFAESVKEAQYAGASERRVSMPPRFDRRQRRVMPKQAI
jgi:hypothetical protein